MSLFNGTVPNQFRPNQSMSRGMLAVVLYNMESNPAPAFTDVPADVSSSEWYAQGVTWAASNGIVTGHGGGQFGSNDNITREQLAVMLWRYVGNPAVTDRELRFADLHWVTENGVDQRQGQRHPGPRRAGTRAETAQMLKIFWKESDAGTIQPRLLPQLLKIASNVNTVDVSVGHPLCFSKERTFNKERENVQKC